MLKLKLISYICALLSKYGKEEAQQGILEQHKV